MTPGELEWRCALNSTTMQTLRILASILMLCAALPCAIHLYILFLRLTGKLAEGAMYMDLQVPGYPQLAIVLLVEAAIIAACIVVRKKIPGRMTVELR
jgi:hypothetical protein